MVRTPCFLCKGALVWCLLGELSQKKKSAPSYLCISAEWSFPLTWTLSLPRWKASEWLQGPAVLTDIHGPDRPQHPASACWYSYTHSVGCSTRYTKEKEKRLEFLVLFLLFSVLNEEQSLFPGSHNSVWFGISNRTLGRMVVAARVERWGSCLLLIQISCLLGTWS